jgi:hypothetical protein
VDALNLTLTYLLLLSGAWLAIPAYTAIRKGYNPIDWVFACGLLGGLYLLLLPYRAGRSDKCLENRARQVAHALSVIQLVILIIFVRVYNK